LTSNNNTTEHWDRVQEIFLAAADLPAGHIAAYLHQVCGEDDALRREVESLLRADGVMEARLAGAIEAEAGALCETPAAPAPEVGGYRVLREIGRGGMGAVYLAERDDGHFQKRVAIKVVKRGMDSDDVLGRFRHERQILANLDHPYIARLIDGGTTVDGRPFFVMDYVEGQPIDVYCRERGLSVEARLRLFLLVCEAVAYAHRGLVVHRDLKPGNVLVTSDGIPKLLDFGVAKLLTPDSSSSLTITASPVRPLTPEYASPEQWRGLPVTTAIDVFALGAVLYELLTGVRARRFGNSTPQDMESVVCDTEAPRPSQAAAEAALGRQLAGDLDNIVAMAMHRDPSRRYQSVDQMADDIRRHLSGRPVLARQDSLAYRAGRYIRRHRLALSAAAVVFTSLLAGVTIALSEARQADAARHIAEAQKETADREQARADQQAQVARIAQERSERRLAQMVELADRSLYDVHTAIERLPGSTDARRRIVATTLQFLENLSKDADPDDRLREVLSAAYFKVADVQGYPLHPNLGDNEGALANYRKSIDLINALLRKQPNNPRYLLQRVDAEVRTAAILWHIEERPRALQILQAALPEARSLARSQPADKDCRDAEISVISEMAAAYKANDNTASLQCERQAIVLLSRMMKDFPGSRDVKLDLASAYSQLGQLLHRTASSDEVVGYYRRSIALREEMVAATPTDAVARRGLMISYANLGSILDSPYVPSRGDATGAREYFGKAVSIARELAQADPSDRLAQYDLANALARQAMIDPPPDERANSLASLRQAQNIFEELLAADPKSSQTAKALTLTGEYAGHRLRDLGRRQEALAEYRKSLSLAQKFLAANPQDLAFVAQTVADEKAIGFTLALEGDCPGAIDYAQRAITLAEQHSAENDAADGYLNLALAHQLFGECNETQAAVTRALAIWDRVTAAGRQITNPRSYEHAKRLLGSCVQGVTTPLDR